MPVSGPGGNSSFQYATKAGELNPAVKFTAQYKGKLNPIH
jgi:hypothetical protein